MVAIPGDEQAVSAVESGVRVLICERQEIYRIGLRTVLEADDGLAVIGEADSQAELLCLAANLRPHVVLAGDPGPCSAVPEVIKGLSSLGVGVVVLTEKSGDVPMMLLAGARGYLPRLAPPDRLRDAVRAVARNDTVLDFDATEALVRQLTQAASRAPEVSGAACGAECGPTEPGADMEGLTQRQLDVTRLVARGFNNSEIAARLHVGEATVKSHLAAVLRKYGLRDRTQLAILALQAHQR
ncbi:response regulator transcription factor [Streptomyces coacervatus]|uniref:Response regulator transcription factor n=1 Tax=Streptomyces coacervatus TaxID=647381 RepID=A0ABP7HTA2_9ACTN|nr:response regulator transcription factor [Streptomyces coacervatus]MDF2267190.1 response regulator transcription factor [Streptomyces coacervatus]